MLHIVVYDFNMVGSRTGYVRFRIYILTPYTLLCSWCYLAAVRRGYDACGQLSVHQELIDQQVIEALFNLHENLSPDGSHRIEEILRQHTQHEASIERMVEIREMVERIDFSWEKGFMDEETYVQKHKQLQNEIEMLRPVAYSDLLKSANSLTEFGTLWAYCKTRKAQRELIKQIIEQVIVLDDEEIALISEWGRRDSNPHLVRDMILSHARLPIPPLPHMESQNYRQCTAHSQG